MWLLALLTLRMQALVRSDRSFALSGQCPL